MNLYDFNTINRILTSHGFTFSKALGQNFIIDSEVCPEMASHLAANDKTGVIEIGPGIGVLTKELCRVAGKVIAIELDKRLFPVLEETLSEFSNLEIIGGDALKLDLNALIAEKFSDMSSVKVCANLPYYITSPVIMTLLESRLPIDEIVVMVQKEAAERFCAEIGSRNSGAVTVAVNYYADARMLFEVPKNCFHPAPKVDSAVMKLTLRDKPPIDVKDEKHFFTVVRAAFAQRRKTALNCLSNGLGISKNQVLSALNTIGKNEKSRAENFTLEEFAKLSELI
ncbi:MAG: 16S rRNA (adenine(1518)-N(6)/adenine(1519)-N(6))-dimethyltransferase RsmA [Eubacterium sp.]|nr:16S rRNA (adenine(1518)-N(6)/adenine(1519)-N(6))-dimethyltransferase RsmA [Eubacterium sp.]